MSDRREQLIRMIIVYGNTHRDFATEAADAIIAAGWVMRHPYQTTAGGIAPYTITTVINGGIVTQPDTGR